MVTEALPASAPKKSLEITDAERLLQTLSVMVNSRSSVQSLHRNIALLDGDTQSFSPLANQLLANGTVSPLWITEWAKIEQRIDRAIKQAAGMSASYGFDYSSVNFILEDAMLMTSLERLVGDPTDILTMTARAGKECVLRTAAELRPNLLASSETVDRYYHSLITAAMIISPRDNDQQFTKEAPAFIAWAKNHEDNAILLDAATRTQSLNQKTIGQFMLMTQATQPALRDGLL
jgi:hypothetical protein